MTATDPATENANLPAGRCVVQQHTIAGQSHYDLMLEMGDVLATFQVPCPPQDWADKQLTCVKLDDHRLMYLDYEGPVLPNRGHVRLVLKGRYRCRSLRENCWQLGLISDIITATLTLRRLGDRQWQLQVTGADRDPVPNDDLP